MMDDDIFIENEFLVDIRGRYVDRAVIKVAIVFGYYTVLGMIKGFDPSQLSVYDHHGRDVTYKFVSNVL